jgi:uncharacterized protein (DUF1501 family)
MKNNTTNCNHEEHELWNRRSFIQALGLSGMGTMAFANQNITFSSTSALAAAIAQSDSENILLIIKLFGGNDGLNMIVPINEYNLYANARPTIKIPETSLIKLTDDKGIPLVMEKLNTMWTEGKMKVVNSVGYPNQSKSHFKGSDAWASAEVESSTYDTGWMGRYYEDVYTDYVFNPPTVPPAIEIGNLRNIAFDGDTNKYSFSVATVSSLQSIANSGINYSMEGLPDCEYGEKLSFLRGSYNNAYRYADKIYAAYNNSTDYTAGDGYPTDNTKLGASLALIARLIKGNLGTKVYMVTISGFDTHTNQVSAQSSLLETLSKSVSYFHEDLTQAGWGDKIVTMAQSEFGRRLNENGSKGTDHGSSGPVMLFGEGLAGNGFIGEYASLESTKLVSGNLNYHIDFRRIYATILKEWLCVNPTTVDNIVLGNYYESLDLGFTCKSLSTNDFTPNQSISIVTYFENDSSMLELKSEIAQHTVIKLYSLQGQEIGTLLNSISNIGTTKMDVKAIFPNLTSGVYIYRMTSNTYKGSGKIMI